MGCEDKSQRAEKLGAARGLLLSVALFVSKGSLHLLSSLVLRRVRRRAEPVRHSPPQRPDAKESYGNGPRLGCIGLDLRPRQATIERFRHGHTATPARGPSGGCDCRRLGAIGGNPRSVPEPPLQAN